MKKFIYPVFLLLMALIAAAILFYPAQQNWYSSYTLDNGMKIVVIPNHKIPAVSHMVWYQVGSIDEEAGKSGLAHFLEHLMFKGTKKYPDGQFSKIVAENAGQENAMTSYDYTAYFQKIEKSKLPLLMELEADRMRGLALTKEQVAAENKVILEERRMRYDNTPRMLLMEKMDVKLFPNHPYGIQVIGWENEMKNLSGKDAMRFYKKYYAPNNAILVVAGDVEPLEVKKLADEHYGKLKTGREINRKTYNITKLQAQEVVLKDKRVKQPEIWIKSQAPNFKENQKDAFALVLLSRILGEGNSSRLYQSLVVEQKLAVAAGTDFDGLRIGPAEFTIYALPAGEIDVPQLNAAIIHELQKIRKKGITEEELGSAKKALIAEIIYSRDSLQGMSFVTGQVVSVGLKPSFVSQYPKLIEAVTANDLRNAAIKYFSEQKIITGILKGK